MKPLTGKRRDGPLSEKRYIAKHRSENLEFDRMTELSSQAAAALRVELKDGVLWLTKTNPECGFGISGAMIEALRAALGRARTEPGVRAVVIDAEEGFHAGATVFLEIRPDWSQFEENDFHFVMELGHRLGQTIADLPIPVISVAAKGALGGGLELMCRSDFVYCTDDAQFTLPEVTAGLIPGWGGTQWVGRLMPHRKAQEFMLLGEPIDGRAAEECGLVTRSFADREALYAHVDRVLARLRRCAPDGFQWTKASLAAIWGGPLAHGVAVGKAGSMTVKNNRTFVKALGARLSGKAFDFVDDKGVTP